MSYYDEGEGDRSLIRHVRRASRFRVAPVAGQGMASKRVERDYGHREEAYAARNALPVTPIQQKVLDALTTEGAGPSVIAKRCGLGAQQVANAVRFLSAKGLATRDAKGWRAV